MASWFAVVGRWMLFWVMTVVSGLLLRHSWASRSDRL